MFSLITRLSLNQFGKHAEGVASIAASIDNAGWITLLVLGALAASGHGGDLLNSLNNISGVPCGGGLMIAGSLITAMVSSVSYRSSEKTLKSHIDDDFDPNWNF